VADKAFFATGDHSYQGLKAETAVENKQLSMEKSGRLGDLARKDGPGDPSLRMAVGALTNNSSCRSRRPSRSPHFGFFLTSSTFGKKSATAL
jgi:hypothetical protein